MTVFTVPRPAPSPTPTPTGVTSVNAREGDVVGLAEQADLTAETARATAAEALKMAAAAPIVQAAVADPSAPVAGSLDIYPKRLVGTSRAVWKSLASEGRGAMLQLSLGQRAFALYAPGSATVLTTLGCSASSQGTLSHPAPTTTLGYATNFASAATVAALAGTGTTSTQFLRGSAAADAAGFLYMARLSFPDASYGAGATGFRFFAGLAAAINPTVAADDPGNNVMGFQFSTARGDANFQVVTEATGAANVVNTAMPFAATHVYDFYLYHAPGGSSLYWRIDDLTAGTTVDCAASPVTTALAGATTALRAGAILGTLDTVARNLRMAKMYVEADR